MVPKAATLADLAREYDSVLLDSFGVLVDGAGALPGARELLGFLAGYDYLVVTNDASRLPETTSRRYQDLGIEVDPDRILTSGMLLAPHFAAHDLHGAETLVLGTEDSREYVRRAGGVVQDVDAERDYDVIVVADDDGYPFFAGVDAALSAIIRRVEAGRPPTLLLPNPDLIYPKAKGQFGFTSGAVALLLEAGLARRLGPDAPRFLALGKPNRPIYEEARRRARGSRLVMVGDQLETDIAGALAAGIDAALLTTGITRWDGTAEVVPHYLVAALWP